MITVHCDCGEAFHAAEEFTGRRLRCRKCGREVLITAPLPLQQRPLRQSLWKVHTPGQLLGLAACLAAVGFVIWASRESTPTPAARQPTAYTVQPPSLLAATEAEDLATPTPSQPSAAAEGTVASPQAVELRTPRPCEAFSVPRPTSGRELPPHSKHRGFGKLSVVNGTDDDAVVLLLNDRRKYAMFVGRHEAARLSSIPQGSYRLRFRLGAMLTTDRRFCYPSRNLEFDDSFDFTEIEGTESTEYSTFEVTLNRVPEGKARTHDVSDEEFEVPPARRGAA